VPGQGTSIWHAITNWGSSAVWFNVLDKRSGEVLKVFIGDTVVVKFEDGSTWEMKFFGPFAPAGKIFQKVLDSERDENGDPIAFVGGSYSTPGGSLDFMFAGLFDLDAAPSYDCAINIQITVCDVATYEGPTHCLEALRQQSVPCTW
jgi:hypothetical protein